MRSAQVCTGLHRSAQVCIWFERAKIDDGEFEFSNHFNNHLNLFRSFLSLLVVK